MEVAVKITEKPQALTNYSKSFEPIPALSKDENELLSIKYKSIPFGLMSDVELFNTVSVLLLKIYAITGWTVPEKELRNILKDQLAKKIKESYTNVNQDEVEYAFRHNLTVKDWGKSMNLVLIDTVLSEYLFKRSEVSLLEERYNRNELPAPVKDEDILSDDDYLEANKTVYKLTKSTGLISTRCYNILLKQGKIKRAEGEERERIIKTVKTNFFSLENREAIKQMSHEEKERFIEADCKKIMVAEYFNQ